MSPRGIRNNNPGNIEDGGFAQSIPGYVGSDGRFAIFDSPDTGIGAIDRLLSSYGKRGLDTPEAIISRWAPPSDNNPTSAYADYVASGLGVTSKDKLAMDDPAVRRKVAERIAQFENGQQVKMPEAKPVKDEDVLARFQSAQTSKPVTDADVLARFSGTGKETETFAGSLPGGRNFRQAHEGGPQPSLAEIPPDTTTLQRGAIEDQNMTEAAAQRSMQRVATPQNIISSEAITDDGGNVYYKDPNTNQLVPTDPKTQVALRDPRDGRLKVFAREEASNLSAPESAARILAPGLATTAPSRLPSAMATIAERVAPVAREGQLVAEAGQRLGVDLPRAVTSDMTGVQQLGKVATSIPLGGTPLRQASQKAIGQLDEAVTDVQGALGSGNVATAGQTAREGITEALRSGPIKERVTELYNKVDDLVNPVTTGPLTNTSRIASAIESRRVNAALPTSGKVAELEEALARPGMNYEGVKDLRTYFGEMLDGSKEVPQGLSMGEAKQIYGALTQDLKLIVAKAGGSDGLKAFERANKAAERWAGIREDLQRVLDVRNEEGIFDRIMAAAGSSSRADISLLGRVRGAVGPEKWDELASAAISRMGRAPDGAFSPDRFVTAYGKMSERGKQMLFRSTGQSSHADALDDIATISQRFKSLNQFANPSGTGQTLMGGSLIGGAWIDPMTAVTSIVSARVLSTILAKPATARSMASWARSYERATLKPTPASLVGFNQASKLFASAVSREAGRPDLIPDLTRQLQGAVPSRAEDKQQ